MLNLIRRKTDKAKSLTSSTHLAFLQPAMQTAATGLEPVHREEPSALPEVTEEDLTEMIL
jgi:hypothetical protein